MDAGEDDGDGGEGMDDDDGGDMFGGFNDGGFDDATVFPTQTQTQDPNADPNSQGFTMVQAPNRVEKIQIGYAKQAKKMDMRRLKTVEWKIMQVRLNSQISESTKVIVTPPRIFVWVQ